MKKLLGLISDTHGSFDPRLPGLLGRADLILHAGDIGSAQILDRMSAIAPVCAVRGNVDAGGDCRHLPGSLLLAVDRVLIFVTHIFAPPTTASPGDDARGARIVLFGHTHEQYLESHHGVLYVNPGTAGPHSPQQAASVALLEIGDGRLNVDHVTLA